MSIFASRKTITLDMPADPGQTVTIQALSGEKFRRAGEEAQVAAMENFRRLGGAEMRREVASLQSAAASAGVSVAEFVEDPVSNFDRAFVLKAGVKAWTYDLEVTDATLADLSEEASEFLAREILRLTKPALFQTAEQRETVQKNG